MKSIDIKQVDCNNTVCSVFMLEKNILSQQAGIKTPSYAYSSNTMYREGGVRNWSVFYLIMN